MTAANVRQMPLDEIAAEIREWAQFADSTDLEEIREACVEVKSYRSDDIVIVQAKQEVLSKLMLRYNELAVAAKEK